MTGSQITSADRAQMQVYAARNYLDDDYRQSNYIEVNLPECLPTSPQNNDYTNVVIPNGYFANKNYQAAGTAVKITNAVIFPLMEGTYCPVAFSKGAVFTLFYSTGKIDEGYLVFMHDVDLKLDDSTKEA